MQEPYIYKEIKIRVKQGKIYRKERFAMDAAFEKANAHESTTDLENTL